MSEHNICPNCQTENPKTEVFCTSCFTPLEHQTQSIHQKNQVNSTTSQSNESNQTTMCSNAICGAEISKNDIVCPYCSETQILEKSETQNVSTIDNNATILVARKRVYLEFSGQEHLVNQSFIFGRDVEQSPFANYFYPDYANVSRSHAEIIYAKDGRVSIKDLGSANGTFINEQQLEKHEIRLLNHQDMIRLASDFIIKVIEK